MFQKHKELSVVRLHALVSDEDTARRAAAGGATVVELRLKGAPTEEVVALGRALGDLDLELLVNDDIDAALEFGCGVHLEPGRPWNRTGARGGDHAGRVGHQAA